jgi:hypothetical protein
MIDFAAAVLLVPHKLESINQMHGHFQQVQCAVAVHDRYCPEVSPSTVLLHTDPGF